MPRQINQPERATTKDLHHDGHAWAVADLSGQRDPTLSRAGGGAQKARRPADDVGGRSTNVPSRPKLARCPASPASAGRARGTH